jgi:coatomer protein complex subunit epsilon
MDELFSLKNLFYTGKVNLINFNCYISFINDHKFHNFILFIGSFQQVINEANSRSQVSETAKLERKIYLYRAYIAQGKYNLVISEIKSTDAIDLQVIKILAIYLQAKTSGSGSGSNGSVGDEKKKEEALKELREVILSDPSNAINSTVQIIAGTIFYNEGLYEEALKVLVRHNKNLEW